MKGPSMTNPDPTDPDYWTRYVEAFPNPADFTFEIPDGVPEIPTAS